MYSPVLANNGCYRHLRIFVISNNGRKGSKNFQILYLTFWAKKNKSYFIFNIKKNVSKLKFVVKNTINLFSMKTFLYKVNQILDQNISRESMIFNKNELCHFPFICTKQVKKANFKTIPSFFMFNSFFCYHQFIGWAIFSRGIE